jgi:hypothetical protein
MPKPTMMGAAATIADHDDGSLQLHPYIRILLTIEAGLVVLRP